MKRAVARPPETPNLFKMEVWDEIEANTEYPQQNAIQGLRLENYQLFCYSTCAGRKAEAFEARFHLKKPHKGVAKMSLPFWLAETRFSSNSPGGGEGGGEKVGICFLKI